MNTFVTILEVVELAALIALVIYLIRLTRDNNDLRNRLNKSELIDRNLEELNEFNGAMVADRDLARIWQDGCEDYRLNDIDRSRFSLMASQYLTLLANQKQRAESIEDWAQAEAATNRLIEALIQNPGLTATWEAISGKTASPELRAAVSQALCPPDTEEPAKETTAVQEVAEPVAQVAAESADISEAVAAEEVAQASEFAQAVVADAPKQETVVMNTAAENAGESTPESAEVENVESSSEEEDNTASDEAAEEETKSNNEFSSAAPEQVAESTTSDESDDVAVAKPA